MSLDLSPEQKAAGKANYEQAVGDLARGGRMPKTMAVGGAPPENPANPTRRDALRAGLAAGAVIPVSAAVYFGYDSWKGNKAVKTALIGCGDEGGVLVGEHNPEFNEIVAVCDIRPTNLERVFKGDTGPRKGLNKIYGEQTAKGIRQYDNLDALLADKASLGLEAVVIATPLNTHDVITKKCMDAGLHVLCEKLMARTIGRCKDMIKTAKEKGLLLSIGHQRHYSPLYAQALEVLNSGILGDIKMIRALWHRNNSWPASYSDSEKAGFALEYGLPHYVDGWFKPVPKKDDDALKGKLDALGFGDPKKYGFKDVGELVRWRISQAAGGGLMAELGSHQLDASSIILGHVRPLAVTGVGGKWFYGPGRNDRESMDSVFVTYEFPGPTHPKGGKGGANADDIVVVTYSSMNTNEFESYGEWVMGSKGTMFLEKEASVYLWREKDKTKRGDAAAGGRDTRVVVTAGGGGRPAMDASSTWGGGGTATLTKGPAGTSEWDTTVRGYRTEMEHFAYCLRRWQERKEPVSYEVGPDGHTLKHADILPRCHGEVAMADAVIALAANKAMKTRTRIEFEDGWFDPASPATPEGPSGVPL
jgi:predicted dehydrogenase